MRPPSSFSESAYMGLGEVSSQSNLDYTPHTPQRVLVLGGGQTNFGTTPRHGLLGKKVPSHGLLGKKVDVDVE